MYCLLRKGRVKIFSSECSYYNKLGYLDFRSGDDDGDEEEDDDDKEEDYDEGDFDDHVHSLRRT